jgi:double-stranded uracil-DNA glycosylase
MNSKGFAPIASAEARMLILGTLPGSISLERGEYYAQRQNVFWRIMGKLIGASPDLPYADRVLCLQNAGVALWDVCAAANRSGSLDSKINWATVVPNDFSDFFRTHPRIRLVCFNGSKAHKLFESKVRPTLAHSAEEISYRTLPSTSSAHAAMPFDEKLSKWRAILDAN